MSAVATSSRVRDLAPVEGGRGSRGGPALVTSIPDPFARVMTLGDHAVNVGLAIGFAIAIGMHAFASAHAITSLTGLLHATQAGRARIHEFLWATYDIELAKKSAPKPEAEPPPPPPEPEPEPAPRAAPKPADPYDVPPAPAKAGKILTAAPQPGDDIEDMTNTMVSGDGDGAGYGRVSANGIGTKPVLGHAVIGGVPGGKGKAAKEPIVDLTGPDLSKPAGLSGGSGGNWNCPFPPEADSDSVDRADVVLRVTVKPDGSPSGVSVVSDPGHGFGRAARTCALGRRYTAALDRMGVAVTQATPNITVHFTR